MTQQDDITQPVLTDVEILRAAINASDSLNITRVHEIGAPSRTIMEDAGLLELGRAIETALLSKLRAEGDGYGEENVYLNARWRGWQARAALASAPVAVPDGWKLVPIEPTPEMEDAGINVPFGQDDSPPPATVYAAMIGAAPDAPVDSAPVAGEAKNYPGDNVAERLDKMADGQPPGSQAQSDLYAAATIWRKHIAHRAAPQASAVAGEAVTWEAVRQELAIFLMGATGRSSKEWHRPLDNASEGGALARMRACLAAPQASAGQVQAALQKSFDMGKFYGSLPETDAEDVRNAALEEAAAICDSMDNHANPMTSRDCADAIRALKQPQAAKDARTCSCPSGDGSLRHPCAVHPPAPLVDESPNLQGSQVDGSTEMQGHAGAVVLPPLPKPVEQIGFLGGRPQDLFDLEGLRSYARAAVLADRQQRATQPEQGERE